MPKPPPDPPAPRLRARPALDWEAGVPRARAFADIYYTAADGLAETRAVFLDGVGLPAAWAGRRLFTVGETGFGTGLNILALWALWRAHRPAGGRLEVLSVEGFPLSAEDLGRAHAPFPELAPLAARLRAKWPPPLRGTHVLSFPEDGLRLTLIFDAVERGLRSAEAQVDAWFLDGFAPAQNPDMWSDAVIAEIARLSAPGARAATFTVAGHVREKLSAHGFSVTRKPGHGRKKHRLEARYEGPAAPAGGLFGTPPPRAPGRALVVGAGIAGLSAAAALKAYGWETCVLDAHGPAAGASGNPAGLVMPRLSLEETPAARFHAAAYLYALTDYSGANTFDPVGILALASSAEDARRQDRLEAAGALAYMGARLDAADASERAGIGLPAGGIFYEGAGLLDAHAWCTALAGGTALRTGATVAALEGGAGGWRALGAGGAVLGEGDICVLAGGATGAALLAEGSVPIAPSRGQVSLVPATKESAGLRTALAFGPYCTPARAGLHLAGATFDPAPDPLTEDLAAHPADHARNLAALKKGLGGILGTPDPATLAGRVAFRATTPDRLPVVGAAPDRAVLLETFAPLRHGRPPEGPAPSRPGLYLHMGLGARGLTTAPLSAALLAAQIAGAPWPVARDVAEAVHPARFLARDLRKRRI